MSKPTFCSALVQHLVPELAEYSQPEFQRPDLVAGVGQRAPFALATEPVGCQLGLGVPDQCFDLGQLLGAI